MRQGAGAAAALALILAAGAAAAGDGVYAPGPLPDRAFYRLVACGAPPGGACVHPFVRWNRRARADLRLRLDPPEAGFPAAALGPLERALDAAVAEVNGAGADLRLRRVPQGAAAEITVRPSRLREGQAIPPGPDVPQGGRMGAGYAVVHWTGTTITRAVILVAADIPADEMRSILLEEVVQSMGLLFDIEGPVHAHRSIFAQDTNSVTRLAGQDAMALRRHYPP